MINPRSDTVALGMYLKLIFEVRLGLNICAYCRVPMGLERLTGEGGKLDGGYLACVAVWWAGG